LFCGISHKRGAVTNTARLTGPIGAPEIVPDFVNEGISQTEKGTCDLARRDRIFLRHLKQIQFKFSNNL
jgi:hypothetical protein